MSLLNCTHCDLAFDETMMITDGLNHHFCCKGCQGVYTLLFDDGLDAFYDKKRNDTIAPPLMTEDSSKKFDLESFRERYIQKDSEGFSTIFLLIEGIHCSACIWLNEKILDKTTGVLEATISFSNNKAKIVWDEEQVKLSEIIDKIRSIGYNAYPFIESKNDKKLTSVKQDYFIRMGVAIFGSMNIMMIDIAKYSGMFLGMSESILSMIHVVEFIFSSLVLFYSGWIFFRGAYYGLKNKLVTMDFLVSSGALISYIYSLFVLFGTKGETYFDSVAMIITFVLVGKYLEVVGKKSAIDTMDKIKSQVPLEATVVKNGIKKIISLDEVKVGDRIEVKYGEKASVDGKSLVDGVIFDESSLTGESLPIEKNRGDIIYSGTINIGKVIQYEAVKNYANSTLNKMVNLLEESLASKPKIEETTNEISKYFSLIILLLAGMSYVGWYLYCEDFEKSLIIMISVIVIACPCALALATPMASLIGISWASSRGILFKEAKFIETFAKATTVVLDKTGTLTKGELSVVKVHTLPKDKELIGLLYALVSSSTHPVSSAIKAYLENNFQEIHTIELEEIHQLSGKGVEARYKNKIITGGNQKLLEEKNINFNTKSEHSLYYFIVDSILIASFELEDSIKENAKVLINYFDRINLEVIMLTGDNKKVASSVANEIGIKKVYAEASPIEKAKYISSLKEEGKTIIMVGDGINDALALSSADIAITMGSGADIALAMSDVVILNNSLEGIKESFVISKRTYHFIKQNLFISLLYNILTIPLAIGGYVVPLVAALSMSLSSLLVVGNSMRIKQKER